VLNPVDRIAEVLFGLIIVLTFTGTISFFYNWADFTYSRRDWLWLGTSAQRTRLYQTDLDIQRGLLVGAGLKQWELTMHQEALSFGSPAFSTSVIAKN